MSELSSQCGCREAKNDCGCGCGRKNNMTWIILLLLFCCNDKDSCGCNNGGIFGRDGSNNCCEMLILLWVLSSCTSCGSIF